MATEELIDYYRGWPASLADDFNLYWRICHYRELDWEKEFAYWSDGSLRKRPHKGKHFSPEEYPPRQNSCRPDRIDEQGAMMEERIGSIRTGIQG